MERFKAVEKAMKTKAYSKEGLSAAAKLDPKEQAKVEASEFLSSMVDELELQIEALEAESESIQATMKKGKSHGAKADRMAEIDRIIERHKWHQGKLELIRRSLENGGVEAEQVHELEESIRYYVSDGVNDDFIEDEEMYDELDLEQEEGAFGMLLENEKGSSQDAQSVQEDLAPDSDPIRTAPRKAPKEAEATGTRRPPSQTKSPLPALATLHTPLPTIGNGNAGGPSMKPASVPSRPAGEGLKYASAAAAAAASDRNNVGISPLPPPPGSGISPLPPAQQRSSAANSPAITAAQPVQQTSVQEPKQPTPAPATATATAPSPVPAPSSSEPEAPPPRSQKKGKAAVKQAAAAAAAEAAAESMKARSNGVTNGTKPTGDFDEESIYHLPASLQDLVESYDIARRRPPHSTAPPTLRMMTASQATCPEVLDADVPRSYRPDMPVPPTASGFPRDPLPIFDDPRLYSRIDPDTLFYVFYYKQGTAQQYLAAKALKDQSWRFHKQYQTWFQRHEEPKNITEEFEQGTYRFFDYESTWMNRRKAEFKFAYKFLEDEV
jgi:CCR4-NOT transcription complex subunit 3